MNQFSDSITKLLYQAIDTVFLSNPFRTSMGFLFGVILKEFSVLLSPIISSLLNVDISSVSIIGWITLSIFLFNFQFLIQRNSGISPDAERAFKLIQIAKRKGISDLEIKQNYRLLIQQYSDNVALNRKLQKELDTIKQQINRQIND
ncbi:hypothetical protein [Adonisia turfae]|uniref:Uncharacterized protein n=1 Tax=Adonisia turfae CCMR0081 TaxID=2292702 RepID=A0A6M0RE84_9CYAN|nr:hypothetical protein [Adonisia turfae]NEZ54193.1 hypothetical protein [Adonisia turfae CCMR0081]